MQTAFTTRRAALRAVLLSTAATAGAFGLVWTPTAGATEAAVSAAAIQYERDWFVSARAARELIEAGALVIDARGKGLRDTQGAVPHAVSVAWQELSQSEAPVKGRLLDDDAALTRKLQAMGVSRDQTVVVVADPLNGWGEDGRVAWTLRTLGHGRVVLVDGSLPALRQLGELRVQAPRLPGDFVVARTPRWEVRKEELRERVARQQVVVLDVREAREFEGATLYGETRGGHLPGAKGLWFKELIGKDGHLLPRADIEKILATKGVTRDTEVVSYCTAGIRSGWFTALLSDMGYKSRNYAGSIWEWSAAPAADYPLARN